MENEAEVPAYAANVIEVRLTLDLGRLAPGIRSGWRGRLAVELRTAAG